MVIAFLIAMGLKPIAKYRYVLSLTFNFSNSLLTTLTLLTSLITLTLFNQPLPPLRIPVVVAS